MTLKKKLALIAIASISIYFTWIIYPHISKVEVTNNANLSEEDISELVELLKKDDFAFSGKGDLEVIMSSFFNPRSRPKFFAVFDGNTSEVGIEAGIIRGPLWGGGPILSAKKEKGHWKLVPSSAMWTS